MTGRLSRSFEEQKIDNIADYRARVMRALRLYYSIDNPEFTWVFANKAMVEIQRELTEVTNEFNLQCSLDLLSAIEARFRIDFAIRCEKRYKDDLSRSFRELYKHHGLHVHLEDDILAAWEEHTSGMKMLLNELRQAFKLRHWLAHGRYRLLKAKVERFNFSYLYTLGSTLSAKFAVGM